MKKILLSALMVCTLGVVSANAMTFQTSAIEMNVQDQNTFIGKWMIKTGETPYGDYSIPMEITKDENGNLTAKSSDEYEIENVKVTSDTTITINMFAMGTSVDVTLTIVDNDNLKGSSMGMVDLTATRIKE